MLVPDRHFPGVRDPRKRIRAPQARKLKIKENEKSAEDVDAFQEKVTELSAGTIEVLVEEERFQPGPP